MEVWQAIFDLLKADYDDGKPSCGKCGQRYLVHFSRCGFTADSHRPAAPMESTQFLELGQEMGWHVSRGKARAFGPSIPAIDAQHKSARFAVPITARGNSDGLIIDTVENIVDA
jgi:hypothetical protein